jgi:hypothetical protein
MLMRVSSLKPRAVSKASVQPSALSASNSNSRRSASVNMFAPLVPPNERRRLMAQRRD